jgi:hypothetical protein
VSAAGIELLWLVINNAPEIRGGNKVLTARAFVAIEYLKTVVPLLLAVVAGQEEEQ